MVPLIPVAIAIGSVVVAGVALSAYIEHLRNVSINEGYEKASEEFNKKYKNQYDEFMSKEKTWEKNKKEYDDLVKAYKEYAEELRREYEDLKKNGSSSASAAAVALLGTTVAKYGAGLDKEVAYYEKCLANLLSLKEQG